MQNTLVTSAFLLVEDFVMENRIRIMNSTKNPKPISVPSTALAAVAFQDHLLRDLSIGNLMTPLKSKKLSVSENLRLDEKRRKLALKKAKPTIDTGLRKKQYDHAKNKTQKDSEYVLDPCPRPLTLAQKLGLIPHNKDQEQLLSESEWSSLKQTSYSRDDFNNPCVICKDDFRLEDQVLLSCSHVFHKACLQSFERYTGRKTCPMCRHESYQTRVVHDGTKFYKHKSATKIQAYWRGYVVRKWYHELRRTIPPKDAKLRKTFYENRLSEITDRMVAMTTSDRVDRFLNDIDHSVAQSRNVFRHFEKSVLSHLTEEEWNDIELRAIERGATDCPICLRSLELSSDFSTQNDRKSSCGSLTKDKESIALLSCTHLFHATCLHALETFSMDDNLNPPLSGEGMSPGTANQFAPGQSNHASFKCPVCRTFYIKRVLALQ